MTPALIQSIRTRLGPTYAMKSDREIGHIVRAVLAEIREPSESMVEAAYSVQRGVDWRVASEEAVAEMVYCAMIDALSASLNQGGE